MRLTMNTALAAAQRSENSQLARICAGAVPLSTTQ